MGWPLGRTAAAELRNRGRWPPPYALLRLKWIVPLCASLRAMPDAIIETLEKAVQALADKYAVTYLELDEQIQKSEEALSSMIDELTGNEYDMKGLAEFKALLKGDANE